MNFIESLQKRCQQQGEKECLFDGTNSLNYAELWDLSGRIYAYLKNEGIAKEQTVMISLDRNVYVMVCMVGILRSGAAFIVMGQDYPEERKTFIKKDTECVLEITEELFQEIMKTESIEGYEKTDPHDLAYMVHTSGTSGQPKCVMQEFGAIENCRRFGKTTDENLFSELDRLGMTSPVNFVACIYHVFYALSTGALFVLIPKQILNNLNVFKQFLQDNKITDVFMTPSFFKITGKLPASVKRVFLYGEAAKEVYCDDLEIYNGYGQSETGANFSFFKIDRPYEITPIGIPCAHISEWALLDEDNRPVKEGQEGEICAKFPYFRGYRNLPEQNAKAIINGFFHTGDIAVKNEEGQLVLLHRKDTMVKINGNRVELTEIENRMSKIIGGKWVAVNVFESGNNSTLCAYYIDELPMPIEELKKQMAQTLADYMLPSFYMKLDKIPFNNNGKFSRKLLPSPDFSIHRKDYKAPVSAMQKKIVTAFEKVLSIEKIGIDEDFFELGGDSLAAIHVITELNLPNLLTTDIFNLRNAQSLAERCEELLEESFDEKTESVQPLIGTQNFMKIYHEKLAESTAYNLSSFYRLKDGVDLIRLKTAISTMMRSHEAFRTTIRKTAQGAELVLGDEIKEIEIIDTTEEELETITKTLIQPYQLYETLLYKCLIYRTEMHAYLFFEMHHILTDGTSLQLILKEIEDGYNGLAIKEDQYFKLIQSRVKEQDSSAYQRDCDYNRKKMPSADRLFLPRFDFQGEEGVPAISSLKLEISQKDLQKIKERYELSPTDFFIMTYLMALSEITGMLKVGTAFTVNGRDSALSQNVVGLLLRSYYVNLDLNKGDTIDEIVFKMRQELAEIQKHRSFDAASFMTKDNCEEIACSNILYQDQLRDTTTNIQKLIEEEIELPNPYYKASYYWEFEIINQMDSIDLVLYYNASKYRPETAEKMLIAYRDVCARIVDGI